MHNISAETPRGGRGQGAGGRGQGAGGRGANFPGAARGLITPNASRCGGFRV